MFGDVAARGVSTEGAPLPDRPDGITRRSFLARTSWLLAPPQSEPRWRRRSSHGPPHRDIEELTIAEMQAAMEAGDLTALS